MKKAFLAAAFALMATGAISQISAKINITETDESGTASIRTEEPEGEIALNGCSEYCCLEISLEGEGEAIIKAMSGSAEIFRKRVLAEGKTSVPIPEKSLQGLVIETTIAGEKRSATLRISGCN